MVFEVGPPLSETQQLLDAAGTKPHQAAEQSSTRSGTIHLLVEDDLISRQQMSLMAEIGNYRFIRGADGQEALRDETIGYLPLRFDRETKEKTMSFQQSQSKSL